MAREDVARGEAYNLDESFERVLAYCAVSVREVWAAVGRHANPAAFQQEPVKLLFRAMRALMSSALEFPRSPEPICQRLRAMQAEGQVTFDQRNEALHLLDFGNSRELEGQARHCIDGFATVLEARFRDAIARAAIAAQASRDMTEHDRLREQLAQVGKVVGLEPALVLGEEDYVLGELTADASVERLPTGVPALDAAFGGGMRAGTQSVCAARSGFGKSMMLAQVAVAAVLRGHAVLYATLEISRRDVLRRVVSCAADAPLSSVGVRRDDLGVRRALRALHGKGALYIADFDPLTTEVGALLDYVRALESKHGRAIRVLVTDYADKLNAPGKTREDQRGYRAMGHVYGAMRTWAEAHNRWSWTASQVKRGAGTKKAELIGMEDLCDSMEKSRVTDQLVSLNYDGDDYTQVRFFVAKNRYGEPGYASAPQPTNFANARVAPCDNDELVRA